MRANERIFLRIMIATSLALILFLLPTAFLPTALLAQMKPEADGWHPANDSRTVIVFVHGFLSDSEAAWTSKDKNGTKYWPDLVAKDKSFDDAAGRPPSIYILGYPTSVWQGKYGVRDAANDVYRRLSDPKQPSGAPLGKQRVVFVAHSLGGIIVREMIRDHVDDAFQRKIIGLFLLGSPSDGTKWANRLSFIGKYFNNPMALQLQENNEMTVDLGREFQDLKESGRLPHLFGKDVFESVFFWRLDYIPGLLPFFGLPRQLVSSSDQGTIFGDYDVIAGTNHSELAKPSSAELNTQNAHDKFRYFYRNTLPAGMARGSSSTQVSFDHVTLTLTEDTRKENMSLNSDFSMWSNAKPDQWDVSTTACGLATIMERAEDRAHAAAALQIGTECRDGAHVYIDQVITDESILSRIRDKQVRLSANVKIQQPFTQGGPELLAFVRAGECKDDPTVARFCSIYTSASSDANIPPGQWHPMSWSATVPHSASKLKIRLSGHVPPAW